ncbi:hypothetical protein V8B55DRAFT_1064571 [Mucor lusitanicus]
MDCNSALNYLKNTPCSAWDFALIVDAIKATNQCSDENAFTALDTILKKNFSAAQTSSFTANWKKMIDSYKKEHKEEITKQTGPKERLYKQLVQTQMNIGSLNTLNNTNTNIINKKKRKLSNPLIHGDTSAQPAQSRTSFTPSSSSKPATTTHARNDRRTTARKSFEELFDESDQEGDEETCLDAENDSDTGSVTLADLPEKLQLDVTKNLISSLQSPSSYRFEGEDINIAEYKMTCLRHIRKQPSVFLELNFTEIIALSHCILFKHGCYSERHSSRTLFRIQL